MKKHYFLLAAGCVALLMFAASSRHATRGGFVVGSPAVKSISALAFGPDGILLIGDSKGATIFALDTKDVVPVEKAAAVEIKNIDQKQCSVIIYWR